MCLSVRFPSFDLSKLMFKFIKFCLNDPKHRERSERAKKIEIFDFVCHVSFIS